MKSKGKPSPEPVFIRRDTFVLSNPGREKMAGILGEFVKMLLAMDDNDAWTEGYAEANLKALDRLQMELGEQVLVLRWYLNEAAYPKES